MKKKLFLGVLGMAVMVAFFFVISQKNRDKSSILYDNTEAYTNFDFYEDVVRPFKVYNSHTVYVTKTKTNAPSGDFYVGAAATIMSWVLAGEITIASGLLGGIPLLASMAYGAETENWRCCGSDGAWCCPYDGYHTNPQHCINEVYDYRSNPAGW